jgi:hypothetical protein
MSVQFFFIPLVETKCFEAQLASKSYDKLASLFHRIVGAPKKKETLLLYLDCAIAGFGRVTRRWARFATCLSF